MRLRSISLAGPLAGMMLLVAAAIASAAIAAEFHAESSPAYVTGQIAEEGQAVLTVNGGTMKCLQSVSGTLVGSAHGGAFDSKELALRDSFTSCSFFGQKVTAETAGCTEVLSNAAAGTGQISIACEPGKAIVFRFTQSGCTLTFGSQAPSGAKFSYSNTGSGNARRLSVKQQAEGLTYVSTGGLCGTSGANGKLTSAPLSLRATADVGGTVPTGLWIF